MLPVDRPTIDDVAPSTSARVASWIRRVDAHAEGSWWWVAGVLAVATLVARLPGLIFNGVFDRDEAFLAVTGDVLRHGGTLYVDVVDRKPPVVPIAYALLRDISVDMRVVRIGVAVLVFLNGLVVVGILRRLSASRRAALFAGVLSILGTAMFLPADAQAANFELWGLLPASVAILAIVSARGSHRPWAWFAVAGAAVVLASQCKQPYIVLVAPVLFEAFRRGRDRLPVLGAALAGGFVALVPVLATQDVSRMVRWAWIDNGDYLDGGVSLWRALAVGLGLTVVFLLFHLPLLFGVWAAAVRRVRLDATIWVWLLASAIVIPVGLRFFGHYYQQLVPPLAVLTGLALDRTRRRTWSVLAALTVGTALVMLVLALVHRPDLTNFTAVGRHVQATTTPTDRILVWGALPDVYVSAERDPAGVFLHGGYLTGNWASRAEPLPSDAIAAAPYSERWRMFWEDVAVDPPVLVIDAARPGTDWADHGPERFPVGSWLDACYTEERVVDGLTVWRRDVVRCPT